MSKSTYLVDGMTCGGCAGKVTDEVEQIPGIVDVDVDLATGGITLTSEGQIDDDEVKGAIERAGYQVAATQ